MGALWNSRGMVDGLPIFVTEERDMAEVVKRGKGSEGPVEEHIDLSGGFVPLTPDSFMAQQAKVAAVPAELTFDSFIAQCGNDISSSEAAAPDAGNEISWRWASERDMPALQMLHFEAEIAAGRGMFLPERSFPGAIAVCERNGKVVGGVFIEESATLTPIGQDRAVLGSVGDYIVPACATLARESGTKPRGFVVLC